MKTNSARHSGTEASNGAEVTRWPAGRTARVLVTDGDQRAALAVVRSLGARGHRIIVLAETGRSLAGVSRYADSRTRAPDALQGPAEFAGRVADLVAEEGIDVVVPITEPAMLALLPERERLRPAVVPFAGYEAFLAASDKEGVLRAAAAAGIAVPEQHAVRNVEQVESVIAHVSFPVVVKPSRSVASQSHRKVAVAVAQDAEGLRAVARGLPGDVFPLLLQRRISGAGTGLFLLRWKGRTVAAFAHRRIREKPPSGGVSVLRVSEPLNQVLLRRSEDLLDRLGWEGVAMVEFKHDDSSGEDYLMEVNPRFWGSLQLAVDAGVDFPALLVDCALGSAPDRLPAYRVGVQTRWLMGDLDHLLIRLRRSAAELNLPRGAPGRLRVLRDFLAAFGPGVHNEVFRVSDPRPALHELARWGRGQ